MFSVYLPFTNRLPSAILLTHLSSSFGHPDSPTDTTHVAFFSDSQGGKHHHPSLQGLLDGPLQLRHVEKELQQDFGYQIRFSYHLDKVL